MTKKPVVSRVRHPALASPRGQNRPIQARDTQKVMPIRNKNLLLPCDIYAPPVQKNFAMTKHMQQFASSIARDVRAPIRRMIKRACREKYANTIHHDLLVNTLSKLEAAEQVQQTSANTL